MSKSRHWFRRTYNINISVIASYINLWDPLQYIIQLICNNSSRAMDTVQAVLSKYPNNLSSNLSEKKNKD